MSTDREWERFIAGLNEWSTARETPGGIEVTFVQPNGDARTIDLVVTPGDWDDYWSVIWGDERSAAAYIQKLVTTEVPADKPFLVYDREQWEASATRDFPPDPLDDFEPGSGGHWVARDRDGNITSRYADWKDQP